MSMWQSAPLSSAIQYRKEFVQIDDLAGYKRCRVQLHAQGIVLRDTVPGAEIKTKKQQVCKAGDFLVAEIDAKVGGFGIVPDGLDRAIVSSHYFLFEVNDNVLNRRFLDFFIRTPAFREQVAAQGSTNYAAIRPNDVLGYKIPLPPLPEQRRIVARIESLAAKIEEATSLRGQTVEETEGLVGSRARTILAAIDEPITELGQWLDQSRDGIQTGPFGAQLSSHEFQDSGVPLLTIGNVQYGGLDIDGVRHVSEEKARQLKRYAIQEGDILFARMGTVGRCCIVPKNAEGTLQTLDIQNGAAAGVGSRTDIYTYGGGDNQVFKLEDPGTPAILPSPKKGLAGSPNEIGNIHPSWFYTWGGDKPAGTPAGAEFVPMAWGYYGNANNNFANWLNYVKGQPGVQNLLGFNEPDSTSQANLTVAQALDGWQYMTGLGIPLGSPAAVHADDQWMRDFMAGAAQRNYRVDYVTIHWYGGNDPNGFINYVDYIHNLYGKPVWVTEFAPADWSGNRGISTQQAYDFMRQVVPALNARSYVQRYSWFSAAVGDAYLGQSALWNPDGSLTDLGRLYSRM